MVSIVLSLTFLGQVPAGATPGEEARRLVQQIEGLQRPIEDFRCEFEGKILNYGSIVAGHEPRYNGLYDTFAGVFTWTRGGDTRNDSYHRMEADKSIVRKASVVLPSEDRAEEYDQPNDNTVGHRETRKPHLLTSRDPGSLGGIFLLNTLRWCVASPQYLCAVSDAEIGGESLKVLAVSLFFEKIPSPLISRFWIDLRKNGHVVRWETYLNGETFDEATINLTPFRVGGSEIWMPTRGEEKSYMDIVIRNGNKEVARSKEPISIVTTHVLGDTMRFNEHPGKEVFAINAKPSTPISDRLRRVIDEYGRRRVPTRTTEAQARARLHEGLVKAEADHASLVVTPASERSGWPSWAAPVLGLVVMGSLIALWVQRRGR